MPYSIFVCTNCDQGPPAHESKGQCLFNPGTTWRAADKRMTWYLVHTLYETRQKTDKRSLRVIRALEAIDDSIPGDGFISQDDSILLYGDL